MSEREESQMVAGGPCGVCRRNPAAGLASMWSPGGEEVWLCHGDDDESPTCYEQASALSSAVREGMSAALARPLDRAVLEGRQP